MDANVTKHVAQYRQYEENIKDSLKGRVKHLPTVESTLGRQQLPFLYEVLVRVAPLKGFWEGYEGLTLELGPSVPPCTIVAFAHGDSYLQTSQRIVNISGVSCLI